MRRGVIGLLWAGFALLALLWTLLAWPMWHLAAWATSAPVTASAADLAQAMPAWLSPWLGAEVAEALRAATAWAMAAAGSALPWLGALAQGTVVVAWGVGLLLLLLLTVMLHAVGVRWLRRAPSQPRPSAA